MERSIFYYALQYLRFDPAWAGKNKATGTLDLRLPVALFLYRMARLSRILMILWKSTWKVI
ncbi:hypothetical protein ACDX66_00640 [Peribacillus frigoritolerans]